MDDTDLEVSQYCQQSNSLLYSEVTCCASCDSDNHCIGVFDGSYRLGKSRQIRSSLPGSTCLQRGHRLNNNVRALAHWHCTADSVYSNSRWGFGFNACPNYWLCVQLLLTSCMSSSFTGPQPGWSFGLKLPTVFSFLHVWVNIFPVGGGSGPVVGLVSKLKVKWRFTLVIVLIALVPTGDLLSMWWCDIKAHWSIQHIHAPYYSLTVELY